MSGTDEFGNTTSNEALSLHLISCQRSAKHSFSNNIKMPWERTFWGPLDHFYKRSELPAPVKELIQIERERPDPDACSSLDATFDSAFRKAGLKALKVCDEKLWADMLSAERKAAIRKWATMVVSEPSAWDIAVKHFSQGQMAFATGGLTDSIKDALVSKASNTLHCRANPLCRFMKFCTEHGMKPWPIREAIVYDFLKSGESFAPTFPRSFLISLSFARHTLGLRGEIDAALTGRTKGVSQTWFLKKRRLVQKAPLSVAQLVQLETLVVSEGRNKADRIAAGFFSFMAYSRARYSDALNVSDLKLDVLETDGVRYGYLEAQSSRVKTSLTLEKKTMFLPMTAPVNTVSGHDWVRTWMKLRQSEHLKGSHCSLLLPKGAMGPRRPWMQAVQACGWKTSLRAQMDQAAAAWELILSRPLFWAGVANLV